MQQRLKLSLQMIKKKTFIPAFLLMSPLLFQQNNVTAQNPCKCTYQKGQTLHYTRTDSPDPLLEVPGYVMLKGKKLDAANKKFMEDVAAGKYKAKTYDFKMSVTDVINRSNGSITEVEYVNPQGKYYSYAVCSKDTLYGIKSKTGYPMVGSNKDTIGFYKPGITQYPVNMKVGDVLPATTDLAYTFPKEMDLSYKKKVVDHVISTSNTWQDRDYVYTQTSNTTFFKEVTKTLKYTLQFSAPTVTYRHVIGEGEIVVGGKTYKALKIEMSLETKVGDMITDVNADEMLMKWSLEFTNKFIVNKANKSEHLKNGGIEWFVPELSAVVAVETFTKDGIPLYKSQISKIE